METQGEDEKLAIETTSEAVSLSSEEASTNPTGIDEKAFVRKLDLRILPPLTILYLLSFLDRSNSKSPYNAKKKRNERLILY